MTAMQSVAAALEGVATWREEQESRRQAEIVDVDSQLEKLQSEIEELQKKLGSLREFRAEIETRDAGSGVVARSYEAIFQALLVQANLLEQRSAEAQASREARDAQVVAMLSKSDIAPLVEEYEAWDDETEALA